jgi:hypothetical protein
MTWVCKWNSEHCGPDHINWGTDHKDCGEVYEGNPHPELGPMWVKWNAGPNGEAWLVSDDMPGKAMGLCNSIARKMERELGPVRQNRRLDAITRLKEIS